MQCDLKIQNVMFEVIKLREKNIEMKNIIVIY